MVCSISLLLVEKVWAAVLKYIMYLCLLVLKTKSHYCERMLLKLESQKLSLNFAAKRMQASQEWSVVYPVQLLWASKSVGVWIRNEAEKNLRGEKSSFSSNAEGPNSIMPFTFPYGMNPEDLCWQERYYQDRTSAPASVLKTALEHLDKTVNLQQSLQE